MTLIVEVVEPLIQDDIEAPATVEFFPVLEHETSQSLVPLPLTDRQYLGLLPVQVYTNTYIGIRQHSFVCRQVIRQR